MIIKALFLRLVFSVADPGGSGLPLFLDQTEAPRAEKYLFWRPRPPLSEGLDPPLVLYKQIQEKAPPHHEKNSRGGTLGITG